MIALRSITRDELSSIRNDVLEVYRRAFRIPSNPEGDGAVARFGAESLDKHAERPGFRCCVAFEDATALGFAYGYSGGPGMYWYDRVTAALRPEIVRQWLSSYFEFVELGVIPDAQRRGIGSKVHNALLEGLPHPTAELSVEKGNEPARRFYEKHGWVSIVEDFHGFGVPYTSMAKALSAIEATGRA